MCVDVGLSLIYAVLVSKFFSVPLNVVLITLSVVFGLLPDIDAPIEIIQRGALGGKEAGFHRELTHYPIIYLPILFLVSLFFGSFWGALLAINVISHLLHDSFWPGWGLKWFWPFSKRNYMVFADRVTGRLSTNLVASWSPAELAATMHKFGDANWFRRMYLNLSPLLVFEVSILIVGLLVLYLSI